MSATRAVAVVRDPRFQDHRGPDGHPERPERLIAVGRELDARRDVLHAMPPRPATRDEILRVHHRDHVDWIAEAGRQAPVRLDPDTYMSAASREVAELAAGAAIDLALAVARREFHSGLAAVRPPGHHAEAGRAMGFCLFNNVAVAARALQAEGMERILILDWDVHHGNGTQHSFESDPSILYFSTHQFPYYPGTGDASEVGVDRGRGTTVNVPMPAGCGDAEYVGALARILPSVVEGFRPEMILVSCGFDAHASDPLASMELSGEGYRAMTRLVRALADERCEGRLALVLEGGYAAAGLQEGTAAVLDVLLDPSPVEAPPLPDLEPGSLLKHVVEGVVAAQASYFPGVGAG